MFVLLGQTLAAKKMILMSVMSLFRTALSALTALIFLISIVPSQATKILVLFIKIILSIN